MLIFIKYFIDEEDDGSVALGGIDLENFDDPYPYVPLEVSYCNIQDEWRHDLLYLYLLI